MQRRNDRPLVRVRRGNRPHRVHPSREDRHERSQAGLPAQGSRPARLPTRSRRLATRPHCGAGSGRCSGTSVPGGVVSSRPLIRSHPTRRRVRGGFVGTPCQRATDAPRFPFHAQPGDDTRRLGDLEHHRPYRRPRFLATAGFSVVVVCCPKCRPKPVLSSPKAKEGPGIPGFPSTPSTPPPARPTLAATYHLRHARREPAPPRTHRCRDRRRRGGDPTRRAVGHAHRNRLRPRGQRPRRPRRRSRVRGQGPAELRPADRARRGRRSRSPIRRPLARGRRPARRRLLARSAHPRGEQTP